MSEEDHRAGERRKWWIQFSWWAVQRGPGLKVGGGGGAFVGDWCQVHKEKLEDIPPAH